MDPPAIKQEQTPRETGVRGDAVPELKGPQVREAQAEEIPVEQRARGRDVGVVEGPLDGEHPVQTERGQRREAAAEEVQGGGGGGDAFALPAFPGPVMCQ